MHFMANCYSRERAEMAAGEGRRRDGSGREGVAVERESLM